MEEEGEVQHDFGVRTTWRGLQLEAQLMKHEQSRPATLKRLEGKKKVRTERICDRFVTETI